MAFSEWHTPIDTRWVHFGDCNGYPPFITLHHSNKHTSSYALHSRTLLVAAVIQPLYYRLCSVISTMQQVVFKFRLIEAVRLAFKPERISEWVLEWMPDWTSEIQRQDDPLHHYIRIISFASRHPLSFGSIPKGNENVSPFVWSSVRAIHSRSSPTLITERSANGVDSTCVRWAHRAQIVNYLNLHLLVFTV